MDRLYKYLIALAALLLLLSVDIDVAITSDTMDRLYNLPLFRYGDEVVSLSSINDRLSQPLLVVDDIIVTYRFAIFAAVVLYSVRRFG